MNTTSRSEPQIDLPDEMFYAIFRGVDIPTLVNGRRVSVQFKRVIDSYLSVNCEGMIRLFNEYCGLVQPQFARTVRLPKARVLGNILSHTNLERYLKESNPEVRDRFFTAVTVQEIDSTENKRFQHLFLLFASDNVLRQRLTDLPQGEPWERSTYTRQFVRTFLEDNNPAHLNRLLSISKLIVPGLMQTVYSLDDKEEKMFHITLAFLKQYPDAAIWDTLSNRRGMAPYLVLAAKICREVSREYSPELEERLLSLLNEAVEHADEDHFFEYIFRNVRTHYCEFLGPQQRALVSAVHRFSEAHVEVDRYRFVKHLVDSEADIEPSCQQLMALNRTSSDPVQGLACFVESISEGQDRQAKALIKAINLLPATLRCAHFSELRHRIALYQSKRPEKYVDYFFGWTDKPYRQWSEAFTQCGLNIDDYPPSKDGQFLRELGRV